MMAGASWGTARRKRNASSGAASAVMPQAVKAMRVRSFIRLSPFGEVDSTGNIGRHESNLEAEVSVPRRFYAGDAIGADDGRVGRPRRDVQPIAGRKVAMLP